MGDHKVYITGFGTVTPAGFSLDSCWQQMLSGKTNLSTESGYPVARLDDPKLLQAMKSLPSKMVESTDRGVLLAALAAQKAFANASDSNSDSAAPAKENMGVIIGSSRGATIRLEQEISSFIEERKVSFHASPSTTAGAFSSTASRLLGTGGLNVSVSSACSTGLNAAGMAYSMIKSGTIDSCLAGGAEAAVTPFTVNILGKLRVLTKSDDKNFPCKPFHPSRSGMLLGEGAAVLCLEKNPATKNPLAEVLSFGSASEQSTLTGLSPDGDGIVLAAKRAFESANISAKDVDLVVAHGSGTKKGDAAEAAAFNTLFADKMPAITCHKWLTGHMLAASSAFSIGLATKHLLEKKTPNIPYDKESSLQIIKGQSLERSKIAMIVGLGFGGSASVLLIKRP